MKSTSIYKSEAGKNRLFAQYENYLETFSVDFERIHVTTRFGKTHVLAAGPLDGKPLFIFQGGNCINPTTLTWFSGLLKDYRVYAPDTIGHPGYSAEVRISGKDRSFADWVSDLMDFFDVASAAFIGPSYGGGIILRLAAFMPERIACAVLVSPAGIRMGSKIEMVHRILVPMLKYQRSGSRGQLDKIADAMSVGSMVERDRDIIGEVFASVKLEQDMPKLTQKRELRGFSAPVLLIAGEQDVFFPADRVIHRAAVIIPNLIKSHSYNMGHFPSERIKRQMEKEIKGFLAEYY